MIASLCFPVESRAQAGSDFIAYPRNLLDLDSGRNTKNPRQLPFNRMPGLSPDYEIGPGDELEITIVGGTDEPLAIKVSGSGNISIPLAGSLTAAGLTAEQLEVAIADRFRERELIRNPEVLVFIAQYEARTIYALGEVDRPGEYAVSFQTTLMDLIFMAGGIDFTAARYGFLHRRNASASSAWRPTYVNAELDQLAREPDRPRDGFEVVRIDLQPLKEGGVLERNIVLRNGDVLYVPRRVIDLVYVVGDVYNPGAFEMPQGKTLRVAEAISWAGGPTRTARMRDGILVRYLPGNQRVERRVDFGAVLRGEQPEFDIEPKDVIFIPTSDGKLVGYGILDIVPRMLLFGLLF
jgi:polysaccharide export outer membrane protein